MMETTVIRSFFFFIVGMFCVGGEVWGLNIVGDTVVGDLSVMGQVHVDGNEVDYGTTGTGVAAVYLSYVENGAVYTVSVEAARAGAVFKWVEDANGASPLNKMELSGNGSLSLFNPVAGTNTAQIVLNPGVADPYITIGGKRVVVTVGTGAIRSVQTIPTGTYGNWAVSVGNNARAQGLYAMAVGESVTAVAKNSMAMGVGVLTNGYGQVALGMYNVPNGTSTVTTPGGVTGDQHLFIVGNGSSNAARSNAFEVRKNGDARVYGKLEAQSVAAQSVTLGVAAGDVPMFVP
jgi:hypothetical protein